MDTGILSSRPDRSISISSYKQKLRNPRMNPSKTNENLAPSNHQNDGRGDGILMKPPQRSFSFSTTSSRQPPLLPLPISKPFSSLPTNSSIDKKPLNNKKWAKYLEASKKRSQSSFSVSKLEKESDGDPNRSNKMKSCDDNDDVVSGWIYSLAPPPSSLPIPKFPAKSEAGYNVEAATRIDANATSNIMKLLHLC